MLALAFLSCSSPPPVPQWIDTGGPMAQDVGAMLCAGRTPGMVLAGHTDGTLSRSTDAGRTWQVSSVLPSRPSILSLAEHPERDDAVFAGTSAGAFLSENGGKSWNILPIVPTDPQLPCRTIAVDPFNPSQMYAGVDRRGIYRSTDGGAHWDRCTLPGPEEKVGMSEVPVISISPVDPNLVVASLTEAGLMKSGDRGTTWTALTPQLAASGTVAASLLLHPRSPATICFGTLAGDVYRSTDGGNTWSPTRQGSDETAVRSLTAFPPDPDRLLATSGSGVMLSTDFGMTWKTISRDLPHTGSSLVMANGGNPPPLFVFGEGVGVRRSDDGGATWQYAGRGLGGSTVSILKVRPGTDVVYAVSGAGVSLFRPSTSWVGASSGLHGGTVTALSFDTRPDSVIYAATGRGVFRTQDGGAEWTPLPGSFGPATTLFFDVHPSIRTRLFTGTSAGLFVSTDRGNSWKPAQHGERMPGVRSFTYCTDNAGIVHAVTHERDIMGSSDGGITWESNRYGIRNSGPPDTILGITRDRADDRLMYCWTAGGEGYRSTNRGMEWDRYAPPWNTGDRIVLWVAREAPHLALALVNGSRIFATSTAGSTWKPFVVERIPAEPLSLTWSFAESALYAGTAGRGVFRLALPPGIAPELP
jgi:photosystem II stability/assembly factor-like uncharacterized protein